MIRIVGPRRLMDPESFLRQVGASVVALDEQWIMVTIQDVDTIVFIFLERLVGLGMGEGTVLQWFHS